MVSKLKLFKRENSRLKLQAYITFETNKILKNLQGWIGEGCVCVFFRGMQILLEYWKQVVFTKNCGVGDFR